MSQSIQGFNSGSFYPESFITSQGPVAANNAGTPSRAQLSAKADQIEKSLPPGSPSINSNTYASLKNFTSDYALKRDDAARRASRLLRSIGAGICRPRSNT